MNVSEYIHLLPVEEGVYVGWNRYYPSIFILNDAALELMDKIKNNTPFEKDEETDYFLREFKKYKFIYDGDMDPSLEDFKQELRLQLEKIKKALNDMDEKQLDYSEIKIMTDDCNLTCSYCVNHSPQKTFCPGEETVSPETKRRVVMRCVQQYMERKKKHNREEAGFFFNGGEILMEWELIREIVRRVKTDYPDMKIKFGVNTNLTLLTEEMARFFKEHDFNVHISIDGYKEANDRTRKYPDGKGSFDDIIGKVEMYRRIAGKPMRAFQGTLEHIDRFEAEKVYDMDQYDFIGARLAPNLLNVSEEDAIKKARLMGKFLELNETRSFRVTESIFTRSKEKINQQEYTFAFNCRGLCALPKPGIEINLSNLSLSQLCAYIHDAALPLEQMNNDIYHPKLKDVTYGFIRSRVEALFENCMGCELAGICSGGCILSGLDNKNKLNPAACAYQKEMWNIYVKKAYNDSLEDDNEEE